VVEQANYQVQQQQPRSPVPYLGATGITKDPELTKWTLAPEDTLQFIELQLKGAIFSSNEKGQLVATPSKKHQKLNEKGRQIVMDTLRAVFHRGVILSSLDSKQIADLTITIHRKVAKALFLSRRDIGVSSTRDIPKIVYENVTVNVYTALNRAKNGATWDKLNQMHVVSESVTHVGGQQSAGVRFGPLNLGSGKI